MLGARSAVDRQRAISVLDIFILPRPTYLAAYQEPTSGERFVKARGCAADQLEADGRPAREGGVLYTHPPMFQMHGFRPYNGLSRKRRFLRGHDRAQGGLRNSATEHVPKLSPETILPK